MPYVKIQWVDHQVTSPRTYEMTRNDDGTVLMTPAFGTVVQAGTPIRASNLNHMDDGIEQANNLADLALSDIADEYDPETAYPVKSLCLYGNELYVCTVSTEGEAWDSTHWERATLADLIYSIRTYIGTIPSGSEASTIVEYVDESMRSVAPSAENISGDNYRIWFGGGDGVPQGITIPITADDLGEGLEIDENGKLAATNATIRIQVGDEVIEHDDEGIIEIPAATTESHGVVKLSDEIGTDENGSLVISSVPFDKVENDEDTTIILG
mgnify:CR=1 FL=1